MKTPALLMAGFCGLVPTLCGQQVTAPPTNDLKVTSKIELPLSRSMKTAEPIKCDHAGNIYARLVDTSTFGNPQAAPVQQISAQGKLAQSFQFTHAGEVVATGRGVFVGSEGDVYEVYGPLHPLVVRFAKDGAVRSKTMLATGVDVDPWQVAVFPSGGFLVTGLTGKDDRTPYTAVFDADGQLVKRIYEPEDEDARTKGEVGDIEFTHNSKFGNFFVERGDVAMGSDGNAYLLRGTSPAWVYVISPKGTLIRKLQVETDADHNFRGIASYGGRLAIGLARFGETIVQVTDLKGNRIGSYVIRGAEGDVLDLACYDSSGFTFATGAAETRPFTITTKVP